MLAVEAVSVGLMFVDCTGGVAAIAMLIGNKRRFADSFGRNDTKTDVVAVVVAAGADVANKRWQDNLLKVVDDVAGTRQ